MNDDEDRSQLLALAASGLAVGALAGLVGSAFNFALVAAERFGFGPVYLDEYPERMRKVTLEQVNEAIRKHLHPDKLHVVVAGDLVKLPE